jgi:hypothetical protein
VTPARNRVAIGRVGPNSVREIVNGLIIGNDLGRADPSSGALFFGLNPEPWGVHMLDSVNAVRVSQSAPATHDDLLVINHVVADAEDRSELKDDPLAGPGWGVLGAKLPWWRGNGQGQCEEGESRTHGGVGLSSTERHTRPGIGEKQTESA